MNSYWKQKGQFSEELPEHVRCYKLLNGCKMYFRHTFPHELYVDRTEKFTNFPELRLRFAGEVKNSLYFYTESDVGEGNTKTYTFYKAFYQRDSIQLSKIGTPLTTDIGVKFAIQQPYFLILTARTATVQSFEGDKKIMNSYNVQYLKGIQSFSFIVWKQYAVIITRSSNGLGTIIPARLFNMQMCVIGIRNSLPLPISVYCQDESLLCMLCGTTLLIFKETLCSVDVEIDHPECEIAGISKRGIFFNASYRLFDKQLDDGIFRSLSLSWRKGLTPEDEGYDTYSNVTEQTSRSVADSSQKKLPDIFPSLCNADNNQMSHVDAESLGKNEFDNMANVSLEYSSEFLNKFTVLGVIGEGGFGSVFKVMNKIDHREYAVKRISVEARKLENALNEVRVMAKLDHEGIVRYHATWVEEPPTGWQHEADFKMLKELGWAKRALANISDDSVFIYIQMQLCAKSMAAWMIDNTVDSSRESSLIPSLFKQIVSAVNYIHKNGMIHRDLKPANILIGENNRVKICDLGIVTQQRINDDHVETSTFRTNIGSRLYMSPEQSSNLANYSSKTDVFALGLIFAELCVVMSVERRTEIFDSYRRGEPQNGLFRDQETAEFVALLTEVNSKKRPNCSDILSHPFLG